MEKQDHTNTFDDETQVSEETIQHLLQEFSENSHVIEDLPNDPSLLKDLLRGMSELLTGKEASEISPAVRDAVATVLMAIPENEALTQRNGELLEQATKDALTGIYNKLGFEEEMDRLREIENRQKGELSVLFLDLDGFKGLNDTWGHAEGDAALKTAAEVMQSCVRGSDVIGRIGGDEFMILMPGTSVEDAAAKGEELIAAMKETKFAEKGLGASVGVASMSQLGAQADFEEVKHAADTAMYEAKNNGKGRVAIYTPVEKAA